MSQLHIARKMLKLTQLELARRANLTQQLIARIEKHQRPLHQLPHSELSRIAAVFALTVDELIDAFDRPAPRIDPAAARKLGQKLRAEKRASSVVGRRARDLDAASP
jgi:transcriptional regulator with XRE-family HTH domain